jgi:hypothetical protein
VPLKFGGYSSMMRGITVEGIGALSQRRSKEFGCPDTSGELQWNFGVMTENMDDCRGDLNRRGEFPRQGKV